MNQFHIPNDEAKKNLFLSAVAQRFRDFKAKLVSGWITKRRKVGGTKKKKIYDGEATPSSEASRDTSFEDPSKLPYQIWRHITAEQWHAFVAQKTTTQKLLQFVSKIARMQNLGSTTTIWVLIRMVRRENRGCMTITPRLRRPRRNRALALRRQLHSGNQIECSIGGVPCMG
ncbi:uncharacterized protein LOC130589960 [Beta vulgaris subsp. vulgaris]|uniref:uncharacterized protein LOC130589960 n=1 Tax=Beta vulgaris subsp. vulgaris TaxID=3555 RepID=UPI002548E2F9|nr:uncharacterized protein LOC130589960 [Beta vulgaris subsp. vulgaris]